MAKSRKTVRGKRTRRNKTVRGGANTPKPSPKPDDDDDYDLPPILKRYDYNPPKKSPSPKLNLTPNSPEIDLERHMEDKRKKQLKAINEHNKQFNLLGVKTRNEIKRDTFRKENEKYLNKILRLARVSKDDFEMFTNKPENQDSEQIKAFLIAKIYDSNKSDKESRKEKIISHIDSDDFDALMSDIRTDAEKDWFPSPIKPVKKD